MFGSASQRRLLSLIQQVEQTEEQDSTPFDADLLLREALALRSFLHTQVDDQELEEAALEWESQLEPLGEEWLTLLDQVVDQADEAHQRGQTFHLNGELFYQVCLKCHDLIGASDERLPVWESVMSGAVYCLKTAKSVCLCQEQD